VNQFVLEADHLRKEVSISKQHTIEVAAMHMKTEDDFGHLSELFSNLQREQATAITENIGALLISTCATFHIRCQGTDCTLRPFVSIVAHTKVTQDFEMKTGELSQSIQDLTCSYNTLKAEHMKLQGK